MTSNIFATVHQDIGLSSLIREYRFAPPRRWRSDSVRTDNASLMLCRQRIAQPLSHLVDRRAIFLSHLANSATLICVRESAFSRSASEVTRHLIHNLCRFSPTLKAVMRYREKHILRYSMRCRPATTPGLTVGFPWRLKAGVWTGAGMSRAADMRTIAKKYSEAAQRALRVLRVSTAMLRNGRALATM
jgi:hypothetical protein